MRNSYQDGVYETTCPILLGKNFTYVLQVKDQIGSFFYFPSLAFHKASGGIRILSRPRILVPFPVPTGIFTLLIGDWFNHDHCLPLLQQLKAMLDGGHKLPSLDDILINGHGSNDASFTVEQAPNDKHDLQGQAASSVGPAVAVLIPPGGSSRWISRAELSESRRQMASKISSRKTYRFRISNVGLQNSLNIRIQGHKMKLVEVEGTHTVQTIYESLDVLVDQSYSVLVTMDQAAQDFYIVASTRFTDKIISTTAILHYSNSNKPVSVPIPGGPTDRIDWSLNQVRSIRTNLSASGPRPNLQGSYNYGLVNITRTIKLVSTAAQVNGKQRYGVNSVYFLPADTPLKLADYFKIGGVFRHIDGHAFWVVGMDGGLWAPNCREQYNLRDSVSRSTTQVYPKSWTSIYIALDNVGMWNVRSEFWARQYLGKQFYLRVYTPVTSVRDEFPIPNNAVLSLSLVMAGALQLANGEVPAIFVLGDSTSDVGTNNYLPQSSIKSNFPHNGVDFPFARATGRFSNGFNTADYLAKLFGFKRSPPTFLSQNGTSAVKRPKFRGINFSSAGCGILDSTGQTTAQGKNVVPMGEQLYQFSIVYNDLLAFKGPSETEKFLAKSLFFISIGSNDILGNYYSSNPIPKEQFIPNLGLVYEKFLRIAIKLCYMLISLGARKFGIVSVPPVGCCPSQRISQANDFTDVKTACCGNGTLNAQGFCTPKANLCSNRDEYLFWDMFHPTQAASKLAAFTLYGGERRFVSPINFSQLPDA
ncbi:signal recognition particle 43 kDa protein [Hibiscus syriacus]|uniref:Signal recognition particle 43 kDa protein n=1 Tax=Hibiscus syriacus TaxID=106335 RepID=A0A6A2XY27_HIBSY|nr:signal recognition particle 43 kDa protein [Hibiscus syriacus]